MPKASKKRKEKAADFAKAKLKLGKGKQLPSNAIDTSFKARSIALPSQTISVEKDAAAPSTKRKLTFDDLLTHLKHYNANTRKDALLGFRELLDAHPELVEHNLTALLNACVRVIGDEDASVRKMLLSFFAWLLPRVSLDDLRPHTPLLLLFTTSAQTHIYPEIRIDAVRFLDILLEVAPDVVTDGWTEQGGVQRQVHGGRVLEGYLGILNAGTTFGEGGDTGPVQATSTASVTLSPASKLVILRSLASFFWHALSSDAMLQSTEQHHDYASIPTWYLASAFSSDQAFNSFDCLLEPSLSMPKTPGLSKRQRHWSSEADPETTSEDVLGLHTLARTSLAGAWSLLDLSEASLSSMNSEDARTAITSRLAHTLHSTLIATFLDCAPSVFSANGSPSEVQLQTVVAVAKIAHTLYGFLLERSSEDVKASTQAREQLEGLLRRMAIYFPFRTADMKRDMQTEDAFQDLNLTFCELSSLLLLSAQTSTKPNKSVSTQIVHVAAHIVNLLHGEPTNSAGALGRPLSSQAYTALLPTIWALLASRTKANAGDALLRAVLEHAIRGSATSATKRASVEFVGRLALLGTDNQYRGSLRLPPSPNQQQSSSDVSQLVYEWVLHLPKTLWELGGRDPLTSEVIMRLLLRLAQRRARCITAEVQDGLSARLAPFFTVSHAARGPLPGPWAKLGAGLRRLALDVAAVIISDATNDGATSKDATSLTQAVAQAVVNTDQEDYWRTLGPLTGPAVLC